jgi:hypothetical protein
MLKFAQREKTKYLVEVGAGQNYASNGRMAETTGVQERLSFNLEADIRRGIQQEPRFRVFANSDLQLRPRLAGKRAIAYAPAIGAGAIPLRETAARR